MRVQTCIANDDFEVLNDFCSEERISVSSLLNVLAVDFLETTDKNRVAHIVGEARKIKQGRPKEGKY